VIVPSGGGDCPDIDGLRKADDYLSSCYFRVISYNAGSSRNTGLPWIWISMDISVNIYNFYM